MMIASQSRITHLLLALSLAIGFSCQQAGSPDGATAGTLPVTKTKGGVEMVMLPGGSFIMGNRRSKEDESVDHQVTLAAFWIDKYEVTQAEYERLDLPNPSHFKGPTLPVEQIKWDQAAFYCNARSREEGLRPCYSEDTTCDYSADGYRLPTEAEWEYACRAGSETDYSYGADLRKLGEYAWYAGNSDKKTHPVGQKRPNAWGLCDMLGNVGEWCNDIYGKDYYQQSPAENPHGPKDGTLYVLRGGGWRSGPETVRSSCRLSETPGFSDACLARDAIGFRCVRKTP
jgi:formylglycine-generating enzyme required for sulfatase activity